MIRQGALQVDKCKIVLRQYLPHPGKGIGVVTAHHIRKIAGLVPGRMLRSQRAVSGKAENKSVVRRHILGHCSSWIGRCLFCIGRCFRRSGDLRYVCGLFGPETAGQLSLCHQPGGQRHAAGSQQRHRCQKGRLVPGGSQPFAAPVRRSRAALFRQPLPAAAV